VASTRLDFLGAAGTVTGSRFLATHGSSRVLVDCGLFQGLRELRRRNWDQFPVDPRTVDAVVLSHAHLDHSGYLPAFVAQGFRGRVFATRNTAELARIVLTDSAHLLAEDAEHARALGYSKHDPPLALYTEADVDAAMDLVTTVDYGIDVDVAAGVRVTLRPAGHILGSSAVTVELVDEHRTVLFSGDLGRPSHPLLLPPAPPPRADVVVVESTYGDRSHADTDGEQFAAAIRRAIGRGGSVVIPAFAVDRTEVILLELRRLRVADRIPSVPVYVDSPMALAALRVYRDAIARRSPDIRPDVAGHDDLFDPGELHELHTVAESKSINDPRWPSIIISASGMATGGRVLHHLESLLPDPANTVILAGYQAEGTRGRELLDGSPALKMHGRYVPVRAEVVDVPMFSVHADGDEIVEWLKQVPAPPETCFVVHGEPRSSATLAHRLRSELGWTTVTPKLAERVTVSRRPG
jgi:metallo-beta-lactamase family protein